MKFNMQSILEQAQKMQEEMEKVKEDVNQKIVTAESGGGMVVVTMSGNNEVKQIKISKEVVNPDDVEMLEDLIVAAVNKANKAASDMVQQEMGRIGGMLPNIPGLNLKL
ncbi:YbaB/EbfC family nucleoid-associated protein [Bacteroidetes/Chlorobi group bacterium ChocPot_Mid]|nr:MAG: YbaB/EbfC family nucleoid-associated protein [Bacteroidetes/Chlorobi group bacterium ChocPot_Mid]